MSRFAASRLLCLNFTYSMCRFFQQHIVFVELYRKSFIRKIFITSFTVPMIDIACFNTARILCLNMHRMMSGCRNNRIGFCYFLAQQQICIIFQIAEPMLYAACLKTCRLNPCIMNGNTRCTVLCVVTALKVSCH